MAVRRRSPVASGRRSEGSLQTPPAAPPSRCDRASEAGVQSGRPASGSSHARTVRRDCGSACRCSRSRLAAAAGPRAASRVLQAGGEQCRPAASVWQSWGWRILRGGPWRSCAEPRARKRGATRAPRIPQTLASYGRLPVGNGQAAAGFSAVFAPGAAAVDGAIGAGAGAAAGFAAAGFGAAFLTAGLALFIAFLALDAAFLGAAFLAARLTFLTAFLAFPAVFFTARLAFLATFLTARLTLAFRATFLAARLTLVFFAAFFTARFLAA